MFTSIMHLSFFCKDIEKEIKFYEEILKAKVKMKIKYKEYLHQPNSPFYKKALTNPEDVCIVYLEVAPLQFIELFPYDEKQKKHQEFNEVIGYSHFSLLTNNIEEVYNEMIRKNVEITSSLKFGNSKTWQFWIADPEGNRIEIMQFSKESFQITGHISK